ncbi:DDE family transposase [Paraburkholderia unamae]|uniref:DDE family transposase n=1 Tax=Paraburkholderia unamae TaxID=219649 RepID=A0ABX5KDZ7_9BURK|nr:DDE family transposase [Paraburkholderia unamae]
MTLAFADQGYTGDTAAHAARDEGMALQVIKLPEAKKGFVLLPRRWVVERSFGWRETNACAVTLLTGVVRREPAFAAHNLVDS